MFPTKYSCCEGDSNVIYRRGMSTRVRKMQVRVLKNHKATEKRLNALADESVIQQESHPGTEKLSTDGSLKYQGKTALIIGAGPGGIMSAVYLAREGFTVQVFEKRDDPRKNPYPLTRANIIALRPDTVEIMQDVGIKFPKEGFKSGVHKRMGVMMLTPESVKSRSSAISGTVYMGERQSIADMMLRDVEDIYANQITFHYKHECKRIDFEAKTVVFEDVHGNGIEQSYDLLVGADGEKSFVRQQLQLLDDTIVTKIYRCKRGYKSIRRLPIVDGNEVSESLKPGYMMVCGLSDKLSVSKKKSGSTVMFLYRSSETIANGNLVTALENFERIRGKEYQWLKDAVPSYFPEEWIKEISDQLKTAPITRQADVIAVSKMYGPSTVLIGDAAHSFSPRMAIGANSAIVDGKVLGDALKVANGDVEEVGKAFHDQRYDEMRALQKAQLADSFGQYVYSLTDFVEYFVGWVDYHVTPRLRQTFPKLVSQPFFIRYATREITGVQALSILRRNACLFAMVCIGIMLVVLKFIAIPFAVYIAKQ